MVVKTSSTSGGSRRAGLRGEANAEALRSAARRLIVEQGEQFTTHELIREADVALQTFYRHFGGKDQFLLEVIGDMIAAHCAQLEAAAVDIDDPVERLHGYVADTLTLFVENRGTGAARFTSSNHWRLHETHPDELAAAIRPFSDLVRRELERIRPDSASSKRAERDAWLITQLVMAVFHHYAFADDDDAPTAADDVWRFCLAAIGPTD